MLSPSGFCHRMLVSREKFKITESVVWEYTSDAAFEQKLPVCHDGRVVRSRSEVCVLRDAKLHRRTLFKGMRRSFGIPVAKWKHKRPGHRFRSIRFMSLYVHRPPFRQSSDQLPGELVRNLLRKLSALCILWVEGLGKPFRRREG